MSGTWVKAAVLACAIVAGHAAVATAQLPKKVLEAGDMPAVHGFSVALVLGDLQGGSSADTLPPGAKKALADLRDFLPYKSYRLLDSQWILCCGSSKVGTGISGRLRGVSALKGGDYEQEYTFSVTVLAVSGQQMSVRFLLSDTPTPAPFKRPAPTGGDVADKDLLLRKMEEVARAEQVSKGVIIDSTFSMDLGETVVIGTSGLKGDRALVALLTAVRRPAPRLSEQGGTR